MTLPLPGHYAPERVGELWVERAGQLAEEASAWAKTHSIRPADTDTRRVAAFGIDCQVSFCHPDGGLFVPGAVEDAQRTLDWLYKNVDQITQLVLSLDTHVLHQVFHPAFWRDAEGGHPAPLTVISPDDVRSGRWIPRRDPEACLEYVEKLAASGRHVLTIWPYHGLLGGMSGALLPAFAEAACFHGFARDTQPFLRQKGSHPLTEMYSVLAPEVRSLGGQTTGELDEALFSHLMSFDAVYVFGQASSHCVLTTLNDLADRIRAENPAWMRKVVILEDAMSPVPPPPLDPLPEALDFPRIAREGLARLADGGMRIARTSDPVAT